MVTLYRLANNSILKIFSIGSNFFYENGKFTPFYDFYSQINRFIPVSIYIYIDRFVWSYCRNLMNVSFFFFHASKIPRKLRVLDRIRPSL